MFQTTRLNNHANLPRKPDILECNCKAHKHIHGFTRNITTYLLAKLMLWEDLFLVWNFSGIFPSHIAIVSFLNGREMETVL